MEGREATGVIMSSRNHGAHFHLNPVEKQIDFIISLIMDDIIINNIINCGLAVMGAAAATTWL